MEWLRKESIYFDAARKEWEANAPQYIDGTFGWVGINDYHNIYSTNQIGTCTWYTSSSANMTTLPSHHPTILTAPEQAGRVRRAGVGGATRRTRRPIGHGHCRPRADLLYESEEGGICHRVCPRCVVREWRARVRSTFASLYCSCLLISLLTWPRSTFRNVLGGRRELTPPPLANLLATSTPSLQRREPGEVGPRGVHARAA